MFISIKQFLKNRLKLKRGPFDRKIGNIDWDNELY